jgi:hypothetical protein
MGNLVSLATTHHAKFEPHIDTQKIDESVIEPKISKKIAVNALDDSTEGWSSHNDQGLTV